MDGGAPYGEMRSVAGGLATNGMLLKVGSGVMVAGGGLIAVTIHPLAGIVIALAAVPCYAAGVLIGAAGEALAAVADTAMTNMMLVARVEAMAGSVQEVAASTAHCAKVNTDAARSLRVVAAAYAPSEEFDDAE